jgi:MFS family permease
MAHNKLTRSPAFAFVLTIGIANLFADMTYEGGASINGQFLASLGASAAAVSIIAGAGEFLGYALRSVSGYAADKTGKLWPITFLGYAVNLLAVPAMALAHAWPVAGAFLLAERTGRALRKPTVEAMLSYTTGRYGPGKVYAVNNALDETGAALGPLFIALCLSLKAGYRTGYSLLLSPALLTLATLVVARIKCPIPSRLEQGGPETAQAEGFTRAYWLYMTGGSIFAAGLVSFELVAFHLAKNGIVTQQMLPVFLSLGTIAAIGASLILGRLFDTIGIGAVVGAIVLASGYSFLVFFGSFWTVLGGLLLWGVAYATQDTLMKVLIASVLPRGKRNFAFGLFYLGYGGGWLLGSIATGLLYERSRPALVGFAVVALLLSIPFFVAGARAQPKTSRPRATEPLRNS